jgi:hypothetical protein
MSLTTSRLVAAVGIENHVVVETKDAVLVAARDRVQDVKQLVNQLKTHARSEALTHRMENPGTIPLELIEVQSGPYLGEDDIVRFDDVYGRSHTTPTR